MRYKGKTVAVLGAGLSGTAAALLLKEEGADVTVLDSAEEKNLLKSTGVARERFPGETLGVVPSAPMVVWDSMRRRPSMFSVPGMCGTRSQV